MRRDPERLTVRETSHPLFFEGENLKGARRALRVPALSLGWRESFEERLITAGDDALGTPKRGEELG